MEKRHLMSLDRGTICSRRMSARGAAYLAGFASGSGRTKERCGSTGPGGFEIF